MKLEVPLDEDLARELIAFWEEIFAPNGADMTLEVLTGDDLPHNRDTVFMERRGRRLGGTCVLTVSNHTTALGGFGEVATAPEMRGSGIATRLCARAVDEFREGGGEALFLGTGNPDAERIYHRLGWRKLAGAQVMALITDGDSPEAFLVDYFREPGLATVRPASERDRLPMIPAVLAPHDWQVLDANVAILSTRYRVQPSCMSLYPRYAAVAGEGKGAWFSAATGDGRVVGMATARLDGAGGCQVDGFTHRTWREWWDELIEAAIAWSASRASLTWVAVSVEDEEKRLMLEGLGFRETEEAAAFELDDRQVAAVRMELAG